jgi:hypothetical protein
MCLLFVIWQDNTPGNREVFYTRSSDGGASFLVDPINLSNTPKDSWGGRIASSGSNVHTLWVEEKTPDFVGAIFDTDIFYTRSINNGVSFGKIVNLSHTPSTESTLPVMALDGNNVHVSWEERSSGPVEIFYARSTDNGASFSTPVNLSKSPGESSFPQIAVSGKNVHILWSEGGQNGEVMYSRSTDDGASFSTPVNLNYNAEASYNPRISLSGKNIHVVWSDNEFKIFHRKSVDNGASFGTIVNPNYGRGIVSAPQVIANGTNAIVLWMDLSFDDVNPNNWEIFMRGMPTQFVIPAVIDLSNTRERSVLIPGGAVLQGSHIYAVWWEGELNTGNDIYFRKYPQN